MSPEIGSLRRVVTVAGIAATAAMLLSLIHGHTGPLIEVARQAEREQALEYVLPPFDNRPLDTARTVTVDDGSAAQLYTSTKGDEVMGRALELSTTEGYGPRIDLLVAVTADGTVSGVYILGHHETPGLGAKMTRGQTSWNDPTAVTGEPFILQFAGASLDGFDFRVRSDGGQVDAITASTITSRAVSRAVERALRSMTEAAKEEG
jgi:electron transport complex protein RnfG